MRFNSRSSRLRASCPVLVDYAAVLDDALNLLVVLGDASVADFHVLLVGGASTTDSIVDVFGLDVVWQRSKCTLAKQQIDLLQRLPVGLLEDEPYCWDSD